LPPNQPVENAQIILTADGTFVLLGKPEYDSLAEGGIVVLYGGNSIAIVSNTKLDLPDGVSNYPLLHVQLEDDDIKELKKRKNNRALVYHGESGKIFVGRVEWFPHLVGGGERAPTGSEMYG
jgi:hypothetical protein